MTTLAEVTAFIFSDAGQHELDRIIDAVKQRNQALRAITAASVFVGAEIRIGNITPRYLAGLTGTVQEITGKSATVLLDAESTQTLRFTRTRIAVGPDVERFPLTDVPLSCCQPK